MSGSLPAVWLKDMRRRLARLPSLRMTRVPDAPAHPVRDPWPGDPLRGARLLKGELELAGSIAALSPGEFAHLAAPPMLRALAHGFAWMRDMRALGTDSARVRARALVAEWIAASHHEPLAERPDVTGARIAAWLGHYDFFAASADDAFRHRLMSRLVADARALAASLPTEELDARAITALKGLIAAAVALPDHAGYLSRALRVMRHADGGLALFNGSKEDSTAQIELALGQGARTGRPPSALIDGGFHRLQAGRSVMIMDCGAPPAPKLDRFAHSGTLSFELSIGRERLIVNCGAAPASNGEWRDACRATAAHSTLIIADTSSAELRPEGLGRRPEHVDVQRQEANGAHWLEASHDGWRKPFGAIHRRRLYMSESGEDIRGEDVVEASAPQPFTVRFHLHPAVDANMQHDGEGVLLRLPGGAGWRLRADGARIGLEESIYLGGHEPRRSEQVVLTGYADAPQHVKWAISKVG